MTTPPSIEIGASTLKQLFHDMDTPQLLEAVEILHAEREKRGKELRFLRNKRYAMSDKGKAARRRCNRRYLAKKKSGASTEVK